MKKAKVNLAKLPAPKSAPEKAFLAATIKKITFVSNGWLAERMGRGQPASASQFARRFVLRDEGRKAVEKLIQSRVRT